MRVLIQTNIPAPYMVCYLEELSKLCEVTALFERSSASDRDDSWRQPMFPFKAIFLHGRNVGSEMAFCTEQIKYFKKGYDRIIIADPASPTGIFSICCLSAMRIPFCIQSEGGFQGSGKGLKEHVKKILIGRADFYLSGMGGTADDYFSLYGKKNGRIYGYPFSSMFKKDIRTQPLSLEEKYAMRETLNIHEEKMILSVGQFIPRKGMDILIRACQGFNKKIGIYIIGGTPPEEYLQLAENEQVAGIHFIGFMPFEIILNYMACSDVFALATREDTWGLVINEAMSQGVPVITTKRCISGTKLVDDYKNGFLVDVEDVQALREKILYVLDHPDIQMQMAEQSIKKIQDYSYENMAATVFKALQRG